MRILVLVVICHLLNHHVSSIDFMNGVDNEVLLQLFERASRQVANELKESLKRILLERHRRDSPLSSPYIENSLNNSIYEKMMKYSEEAKRVETNYVIGLKVMKFLKSSPLVDKKLLSSNLKAPAKFCPFQRQKQCNRFRKYREIDGSCNNLESPLLGMSSTPYKRHLLPDYDDGIDSTKWRSKNGEPLPNPRYIALVVHEPQDKDSELANLGVMFGQFIDHDFSFTSATTNSDGSRLKCTCSSTDTDCINIKTPPNDRINADQKCMKLTRSGASFKNLECELSGREQLNTQTHFLDLSQLYGSDIDQANSLRSFRRGMLKTQRIPGFRGSFLPRAKTGTCSDETSKRLCFESGDSRTSQNLLLVGIHNIWMREHNRLARGLRKLNRHWNDETLYQEARRINIAVYQNIIYSEWLPIMIGNDLIRDNNLEITNLKYFFGYNSNINPSLSGEFMGAAYRFGHSLVTSFYSKCDNNLNIFENISLATIMFKPTEAYVTGGLDSISRGLLFETGSKMDNHLTDAIQNRLFENSNPTETHRFSLSAVNIMRGRDHGLQGYNEFRQLAGLRKAQNFDDLIEIPSQLREKLKHLYKDVNDIDAFTGGISETPRAGSVMGPTFATIVAKQFKDLKEGDRYYFENGDRNIRFSPAQMEEIKKITMAGIMCNSLDLNFIQPRAFLPTDRRKNKPMDCMKTPLLDLSKWRNEPVF